MFEEPNEKDERRRHQYSDCARSTYWLGSLGSVRKVQTGRIGAMTGWRPAWQSVTNSRMQLGS